MQDDSRIESRHPGQKPGNELLSLDSARGGGEFADLARGRAAPEALFGIAEKLYMAIRGELARQLDRCARLQHPDAALASARRDPDDFDAARMAEAIAALQGDLARLRALLELALELAGLDRGGALGLGELEELGDFCRRLAAGESLLAERLRPLLLASWRQPGDPWLELGSRYEGWHRQNFEQLVALGGGFRELVTRRLGIDPTSSAVFNVPVVAINRFDELLLGLEREHLSLDELADWVGIAAPELDDVEARVLFATLLPRLIAAAAQADSLAETRAVEKIVGLFADRDFFARRRHSDGIVELTGHLDAQLERWQADAETARQERVDLRERPVDDAAFEAALMRLPAPVQRLLARQGRFVAIFASHPEYLVAREVAHYLHVDNLERFLQLRELNRRVFEDLLRAIDLGHRPDLLTLTLCHPQCPLVFAGRQLTRLSSTQLHQIIQSSATHPEVKRKAMLSMIRQRNGQNVLADEAPASPPARS